MRIGLCAKGEAWDEAERAGFEYLELPFNQVANMDEKEFESLLGENEKHRIKVEKMNLLYPKGMHLFTVDPSEESAYLEKGFDRMSRLGAKIVVFGSGKSRMVPQGICLEEAAIILATHTRKACDVASRHGITIALEPLNRKETNVLLSLTEGALFSSLVGKENFAILADMFHMVSENEPWEHIPMVGKLVHAHIAVRGSRAYPLDEKDEDTLEFLSSLKAIGYQGDLSIEGKTDDIERDGKLALSVLRKLYG